MNIAQELAKYRLAKLQGRETTLADGITDRLAGLTIQDFLLSTPLDERILLDLQTIPNIQNNEIDTEWCALHPYLSFRANGLIVNMRNDANGSARAIIFSLLLLTKLSINAQLRNATKMQHIIWFLDNEIVELMHLYQRGWPPLQKQSSAFPQECNTLRSILNAISNNQITLTALLYLANDDCCTLEDITPCNSINQAFTDLMHFILYKSSLKYIRENYAELNEEEQVKIIRPDSPGSPGSSCTLLIDLLHSTKG